MNLVRWALVASCAAAIAVGTAFTAPASAAIGSPVVSEAASAVSDLFKQTGRQLEAGGQSHDPLAAASSNLTKAMLELLEARLRAF